MMTLDKEKLYREALLDAVIMFENYERNRNLPGNAARGQYKAMAQSIRKLLKDTE